jgi:ribulose-phosphate 3-epimerase
MTRPIKIAPSILSADFARLGDEIAAAAAAGADQIHVDVMDGHYVPNITIGPVVVKSIRRITDLPLDVHLMISEPARYVQAFADAGANALTVHVEADPHLHRTVQHIHDVGLKAGVALNPATPVAALSAIVADVEIVLVMSVNPGFGGQAFIPGSVEKIAALRALLDGAGLRPDLAVDGGISVETAGLVVSAGVDVLVAGSAIFQPGVGISAAVSNLRRAAGQAQPLR